MKRDTGDDGFTKTLERYNAAFSGSRPEWFDFYSREASIYAIGATEPIVGRDAYKKNFGKLQAVPREVEEVKRDVRVMDDTAVVMQLLTITQDDVVTYLREGTIWKREDGQWRIVHLNASLAADSVPVRPVTDHRQIRVLRDKLATSSVQVGVAQ